MALIDTITASYRFDDASGNSVDSSGNGNTLTNNNSITFVAGLINNGADFGTANSNKYFSLDQRTY